MKIIKETFFSVIPRGGMRATQDMFWLTKVTEQETMALDAKWVQKDTGIGSVWVTKKWDKKAGVFKEYARKTAPSYTRQRKYLIAQYDVVKELSRLAAEQEFIMPEDDFAVVCMMPMPRTWTKKKKLEMAYQLHKSKPDADNAIKLLIDTMFKKDSASGRFRNDSCVSSIMCVKYYVPDDVEPGYKIIEYEKSFFLNLVL